MPAAVSQSEVLQALDRAKRLVAQIHEQPGRGELALNGHCAVCSTWHGNVGGCPGCLGTHEPRCWRLRIAGGGDVDPVTGDLR